MLLLILGQICVYSFMLHYCGFYYKKIVLKKRKFSKNDIVEVEEVAKGKDGAEAKKQANFVAEMTPNFLKLGLD